MYIYVLSGAGRHQHSSNMNRIAVHNHTQAGHLQFCSTFVRCGLHTFKCLVKASRSTRNFYQDGILTRLLTLHRHLQWIHLQSSSCSCKSEILSIDILCILCLWQLVIVIALLFVAVRGLLDQIQLLSKVTSCWFCSSTSRTNVSTAGETLDSSYSRYWNRWTHTHLPLRINSPSASCRVSTLWQLEIFASHRNSPQQTFVFRKLVRVHNHSWLCIWRSALQAQTSLYCDAVTPNTSWAQSISMHLNVSHNFVMRPDYFTIPSLYSTTVLAFVAAIQPLPNFTLWVADAL